ncbi:MAG: hypothetical protein IPL98_17030 [Saprospiraceae bacterium]|nr:hypothetical protein [Saprospiraceae bacterium]
MKKIAIIGPNYPYRGGNSLFIGHLCIALQEKFELFIINYSLLYPEILFPGKTQYDKSNEVMDGIRQLKTHRILNSINPISWYNTAKKIKEFNPDLVVVDWWQPFLVPVILVYLVYWEVITKIVFCLLLRMLYLMNRDL